MKKIKKKIIQFLRWALLKLDKAPIEVDQVAYIFSDFQTKKGGIDILEAKKLVVGHCLSQVKKYVHVASVSGHEGYEKAIASVRVSRKLNIGQ